MTTNISTPPINWQSYADNINNLLNKQKEDYDEECILKGRIMKIEKDRDKCKQLLNSYKKLYEEKSNYITKLEKENIELRSDYIELYRNVNRRYIWSDYWFMFMLLIFVSQQLC
jgi:hypothetical protein